MNTPLSRFFRSFIPGARSPALGAALLTILGMASSHAASPSAFQTEQAQVRLVPSVTQVRPGERITVGLQQRIIPHWHTYWQNPGDSGLPTTLTWTLPTGGKADPIQWPIPKHFDLGPVTNFGYDTEVTLLSEITVPADLQPGESLPIEVQANWLVCEEVCIPQKAQLGLVLPVVARTSPDQPIDPLITQARSQLPRQPAWSAQAHQSAQGVSLRVPFQALPADGSATLRFFPTQWGHLSHQAAQISEARGDQQVLSLSAGEAPLQVGQALDGVLVVSQGTGDQATRLGYVIHTPLQPALVEPPASGADRAGEPALGLASALVLALLGGLVLNLMPCVFPVLSIKALALLSHSEQSPAQARLHGLAYTGGVLASFALLAGALIALKAGGGQVGWGFQFHSPAFVLAVAYLMFAVGLSLSGVFSIGHSVTGVGQSLANRPGYAGSFFAGVLATIVATPCTAPFMGGAIGFALGQPAAVLMAVFLSLGLGLALPYLVLSAWPPLQRWLPRPGVWMERVKQVLAFPMYAAAAWLVWVLAQQAGIDAVAIALAGLIVIAFAAWSYDSSRSGSLRTQRGGAALAVLALSGALAGGYLGVQSLDSGAAGQTRSVASDPKASWTPYTRARLDALRAEGKPVFLNFTAAWCITCLVNERVALNKPEVNAAFQTGGITYLKGDWTRQDPEITDVLRRFGRSGVPLYVYYPAGAQSQPVVLPQILTPGLVLSSLEGARQVAVSP